MNSGRYAYIYINLLPYGYGYGYGYGNRLYCFMGLRSKKLDWMGDGVDTRRLL